MFKVFLSVLVLCAFVAGFFYGDVMDAHANPFKQDRREDTMLDSRKLMLTNRAQPNTAKAHRKRVLEAMDRESGRDRSKKLNATLRVQPRKASERTNHGFQ